MSHEIMESDNLVLTEGLPAWHRLGTVVQDEAITVERALELAGLGGWNLRKIDLAGVPGDGAPLVPVAKSAGIYRPKDNRVIGVVGKSTYRIIQNEEAFSWAEQLLGGSGCLVKTAGSLKNGAIVWVLMKLPFEVTLPDSKLVHYLLLWNTHDGSGAMKAQLVTVRVVCANTLRLADHSAAASYSIRHTRNAEDRLGEAQRVLGLAQGAADRAEELARRLLDIKVTEPAWFTLLDTIVPLPPEDNKATRTIVGKTRDAITAIYRNAPDQVPIVGTAWGAYNAFTNYVDHVARRKDDESRMLASVAQPNLATKALAVLAG